MSPASPKNILLAPLDWGLGHASRCMPVIDLLLKKNHNVFIAGNGDSLHLLQEQYPSLKFYELPGYNISYGAGKNAALQGLLQTPKILKTISEENKMTQEIIQKENIDLIVSDNRYGVRSEKAKSIFLSHHIALQAPDNFSFMNPVFLRMHLNLIKKFDALWIPDEEDENNLSGRLSHGISFPIPHTYIGIQSRFANFVKKPSIVDNLHFSTLIVLSGPEPARTLTETKLKSIFKNRFEQVLLVQGKAGDQNVREEGNIFIVSYLNANNLYAALQKASVIICRSGYSTVMDLAVLGKKAILLPSQGQTEQEYLAKTLANKGFSVECRQDDMDIEKALKDLEKMDGFPVFKTSQEKLEEILKQNLDN